MGVRALGRVTAALFVVAALTASGVRAREVGDEALARALSAARQARLLGDVKEAERIYREILDENPDDLRAFWGLVNVYASAGMDSDKLIPLLTERLEESPLDLKVKKELGAAYARIGEHERAHEIWWDALHQGAPDPALYSEIGALELRHRMTGEAIETYLEARRVFQAPTFFGQELVQAYTLLADYRQAIRECVVVVNEHGGMVQWATNRVELMLERGAKRKDIEREVDAIAKDDRASPAALSFAGSVYLVLERPDRALDSFLEADRRAGEDGRALLEFGSILRDAGRPEEAREAFRMLIERHPGTVNAAKAGVAAGRIRAALGDSEGALAELKEIGRQYTAYSAGGEALLAAAEIELVDLEDPESALATLEELLEGDRRRGRQLVQEARLREVDAYLALGQFDEAYAEAESLVSEKAPAAIRERAMFSLGFVSFLKLDVERALSEFRAMVEDEAAGKFVNDALRFMLIIAESEEDLGSDPIALFASAQAASLRGDRREARRLLAELADRYPGTSVGVEGLLLGAALAVEQGDYDDALRVYAEILETADSIPARAEALMRRGDIFLNDLDREEEAAREYAAVLKDLPPNALTGEARRKLEDIRKGGAAG